MSAHVSAHAQNRPCRTSTEALSWAWNQRLPPVPKLALLNMAGGPILGRAGDEDSVYSAMLNTAHDTASFCGIDVAAATRTLDWLLERGFTRIYAEGLSVNWERIP